METDLLTPSNTENASMLPPATGSTNINVETNERIVSVLAGAAATVYGLRNLGSLGGIVMALSGGYLLTRGITGYCSINNLIGRDPVNRKASALEIKGTFTINKPRAEVYAFWRRLENLPLFMKHLEEVKQEDHFRSVWRARVPGGFGTVSWEAAITEDKAGELLRWSSLAGSTIDNAGEVRFTDAPANRGTEITACITYRLPGGDFGSLAGKLFNPVVERMMKEDLRKFKSIIETGEVPTTTGQPSARETDKTKARRKRLSKTSVSNQEQSLTQEQTLNQDQTLSEDQNLPQSYEGPVLERDRQFNS